MAEETSWSRSDISGSGFLRAKQTWTVISPIEYRLNDNRNWAPKETTSTLHGSLADFEFHVHPGNTSKDILERVMTLVSTSRDAVGNLYTPDTFLERLLSTLASNATPADAQNPSVFSTQRCLDEARTIVQHAASFHKDCWCFIAPGSEEKWHVDMYADPSRRPQGSGTVLPRKSLFHFSNQVTQSSQRRRCIEQELQRQEHNQHAFHCRI